MNAHILASNHFGLIKTSQFGYYCKILITTIGARKWKKMNIDQLNKILMQNDCVVVYFSSPNCGVCISLKPKVISIANSYENLKVLDIDVATSPEIANRFGVFTAPTVIVFLCGKESGRFSRSFGVGQISSILDRFYEITQR